MKMREAGTIKTPFSILVKSWIGNEGKRERRKRNSCPWVVHLERRHCLKWEEEPVANELLLEKEEQRNGGEMGKICVRE